MCSLSSAGPLTSSALFWLTEWVLAFTAERRATRRHRIDSTRRSLRGTSAFRSCDQTTSETGYACGQSPIQRTRHGVRPASNASHLRAYQPQGFGGKVKHFQSVLQGRVSCTTRWSSTASVLCPN